MQSGSDRSKRRLTRIVLVAMLSLCLAFGMVPAYALENAANATYDASAGAAQVTLQAAEEAESGNAQQVSLLPQYTYNFSLALDNKWRDMSLTLGTVDWDAWKFKVTRKSKVTITVGSSNSDLRFSIHTGTSTSKTQKGGTGAILAEFRGQTDQDSISVTLGAGTYYVIVRDWASNSANGSHSYRIKGSVSGKSITKAKVTGVKKSYLYRAKSFKPNPKVVYGKKTLKRGTHYTLSYRKNKNAGTATILIKGKGAYTGTKKKTFKINRRSLVRASVSRVKKRVYTGNAIKPRPTIKLRIGRSTRKLKLGRDYTLSYRDNKLPGTAVMYIKGKGNYKGTKKVRFTIVRGRYYKLKRDVWKFHNINYAIPYSIYKRVFGASKGRLVQRLNDGTGGNCYGMAASVGSIARYKAPKVQSFRKGSKKAYSIRKIGLSWKSTQNKLTAKRFIQACHIMQYDYLMIQQENRYWNDFDAIANAIRRTVRGGNPAVISLFGYDERGNKIGHALFPLAVKTNSSRMVAYVYDSNYPNNVQELVLYRSRGHYRSYSYLVNDGNRWTRGLSYTTPSHRTTGYLKGGGNYKGNADATLVAVSSDMQLVGEEGESYTLSDSAASSSDKVLRVESKGASSDAEQLYYVNLDSDKLGFTSLEQDATVSVAAETKSVEVSASAGSDVVVDMSETTDDTVIVDTESGSDFKMSFQEETASGELEEVVVEGTAKGVVVGQRSEDGFIVSGAETMSVTSGDATTGEVELDSDKVYRIESADNGVSEADAADEAKVAEAEASLEEVLA